MPVQTQNSRANWLLDVLAHPPARDNTFCHFFLSSVMFCIQRKVTFHFKLIREFCATSPVIFLLKVADGDEPRAAANSKLVLFGRPLHTASSAVDPEDDQGGLPRSLFQGPHIGVAVGTTCDDTITVRSPVNTCREKQLLYCLIDTTELNIFGYSF